jgi:hypothetical protein
MLVFIFGSNLCTMTRDTFGSGDCPHTLSVDLWLLNFPGVMPPGCIVPGFKPVDTYMIVREPNPQIPGPVL